MGAVHRIDRDIDARHHQCPPGRDARAQTQRVAQLNASNEIDRHAMTTRIDRRFAELKAQGRAALVTFLTAGDPDPETSLAILQALPAAGADVIELGMPFTDPMADGPAIQMSSPARAQGRADPEEDARAWCAPSARPTTRRRSC